jgi:hypothetical protein
MDLTKKHRRRHRTIRRRTKIFCLSADILKDVTILLTAESISKLYFCGNKGLNYMMTVAGGVQELNFLILPWRPLKWPSLPSFFPHLTSLRFEVAENPHLHPISDIDLYSISSQLKKLQLIYKNGSLDLSIQLDPEHTNGKIPIEIYPNFSDLFPKLEELHIVQRRKIHSRLFRVLPQTLTKLHLHTPLHPIVTQFFNAIPPSLIHLTIMTPSTSENILKSRLSILPPLHLSSFESIDESKVYQMVFPPNLTRFECNLPNVTEMIENLPKSVTHVEAFSSMPSYARSNIQDNNILNPNIRFPPFLKTLVLQIPKIIENFNGWGLPLSLTSLTLSNSVFFMTKTMAKTLPRNLKQFNINNIGNLSDKSIRSLPRNFESLMDFTSTIRSDVYFQSLPPHLISLELIRGHISRKQANFLPLTLTHLSVATMESNAIIHLPPNLKKLQIFITSFTCSEIANFPKSLDSVLLIESKSEYCSQSRFKCLSGLKTLRLQANSLFLCHCKTNIIPETVTSLDLCSFAFDMVIHRLSLVSNHNLSSLKISKSKLRRRNFSFKDLPKTLLNLDCATFKDPINASNVFPDLPPNLTRLSLDSKHHNKAYFTYTDLKLLPKSLTVCHLPGSLSSYEKCIKYISPMMKSFTCGSFVVKSQRE